jgi:hypothetical protein
VGNDKIGGNRFLYNPSSYLYSGSLAFGVPGSTYQTYPAAVEGIIGNPLSCMGKSKKIQYRFGYEPLEKIKLKS